MAIKTREEILTDIKTRLGNSTDDDTITFLEDITDTLSDLESRANDGTDWRTKYEENDAEWRQRYTERFYSSEPEGNPPVPQPNEPDEPEKPKDFSDLFKTE